MAESKHPTYTIVDNEKDADGSAWVFPEPSDKMERVYFKFPPIADDEVRIKTTYAGLCHSDVHTVRNDWYEVPFRPIAPGHEILGIVTQVGKNVTDWKVGEKAGFGCFRDFCGNCKNCKNNDDHFCLDQTLDRFTYGGKYWGGYADHVQQPAKLFFRVPEGIPDEVVPPLFCAGITSYSPIKEYVKKGDNVGVLGVGGVGHMAVQYIKSWGANCYAFTTTKEKTESLKKMGAAEVVVTTEEGAVEKLAGKIDVLINFLPTCDTQTFNRYFATLGPMGTFVQIGVPKSTETIQFSLPSIVMGEKRVVGSLIGPKQRIIEMLEFSAQHKNFPYCEVFEYEDLPKAYDRLVNGKPQYRCVVKVSKNL